MKFYYIYIKKITQFYYILGNVIHGEEKMKSNFNFNFGVENEIVWYVAMSEIEWRMLKIYHVEYYLKNI